MHSTNFVIKIYINVIKCKLFKITSKFNNFHPIKMHNNLFCFNANVGYIFFTFVNLS